jgi:twitching motility protein PilT
METKLGLFERVALASKLVTQAQLAAALQEQARRGDGTHLGHVLVELGHLQPKQLEQLIAMQRQVVQKARSRKDDAPSAAAPALSADGASAESLPLDELLAHAIASGASDVHIHSGAVIKVRCHGQFMNFGTRVLEPAEAERFAREAFVNPSHAERFDKDGEVDLCYVLPGKARLRGNIYRQLRGCDAVFRVIPPEPPTLAQLGLPETLAKLTKFHQGMVLITGPTRCGKSSTMAALVNLVNENRREHILTIEDPIEYEHRSKGCLVNQRSVSLHTRSFARALRGALREDPDIIVIGELRDQESISLALTAAETGHFVLATLHTDNAVRTVNRIIGAFPPDQQEQVRSMVSESLRAVISQRLLPTADEQGVVPALEIMTGTLAVGNLIRENKTIQMRSLLQTGAEHGMMLLDNSLAELVRQKRVTREQALRHAEDPNVIPGG